MRDEMKEKSLFFWPNYMNWWCYKFWEKKTKSTLVGWSMSEGVSGWRGTRGTGVQATAPQRSLILEATPLGRGSKPWRNVTQWRCPNADLKITLLRRTPSETNPRVDKLTVSRYLPTPWIPRVFQLPHSTALCSSQDHENPVFFSPAHRTRERGQVDFWNILT